MVDPDLQPPPASVLGCHLPEEMLCSYQHQVPHAFAHVVAVCEAADVVVRRRATSRGGSALEVRVAIIGNVDSGKSTMVGVLTRSMLDDGRGLARSKVFKHGHEESTGRTSSIGQHNLCVRAAPRAPCRPALQAAVSLLRVLLQF